MSTSDDFPSIEVFGLARPLYAEAVMPDGRKVPIEGWIMDGTETLVEAIERTAREMGGTRAQIHLTDIG